MRRLLLRLADRPRIGAAMDRFALTRRFVRRFVAGREAGDALAVLGALDASGLTSAVTCLGENVSARADAERGIAADRFEFQMLYGIRHDLHAPLRDAGVTLRVLVPFGEDWYGYFMRRLAERPANLLFLLRHALRG